MKTTEPSVFVDLAYGSVEFVHLVADLVLSLIYATSWLKIIPHPVAEAWAASVYLAKFIAEVMRYVVPLLT